ncbi:hypothetical protein [Streptomyces phaeoluteigriseus]
MPVWLPWWCGGCGPLLGKGGAEVFRPDPATLRSAGFVVLLTGVFLLVNSQVVYAASSNGGTGDLLAPLNITSSEGVPIDGYELNAEGGSIVAFKTQALAFALSGVFTLIRLLVGLAGWAIEVAFRFPLLKILTRPAQKVADAYDNVVVDTLGLKGLLLAWAFVFGGFMIVRGRVGRGLGEIFLTLLIAAFAASALIRPDTLSLPGRAAGAVPAGGRRGRAAERQFLRLGRKARQLRPMRRHGRQRGDQVRGT